jgi:hypothetical protein
MTQNGERLTQNLPWANLTAHWKADNMRSVIVPRMGV